MPTAAMATIDTLPCELLTEILSHLPGAYLARTALVSRRMHDHCVPLLYRVPVLRYSGRTTLRPSLKIFLWTVLTPGRESLTTHVRSLRAYWYWTRYTKPCPSEDALLDPVASRFGLRRGVHSQGAQLVLLIHLLPRLRVLTVTPPVRFSTFTKMMDARYTQLVDPTSPTPPLVLQSLREFISPADQTGNGISHKTLVVLLLLPCIRVIDVQIADHDPFSLRAMKTAWFGSSSVSQLRIEDPNMAPRYLSLVIPLTRALTHFSYSTARRRAEFDHEGFWAALRPLRTTLVALHLDIKLAPRGAVWEGVGWSFREWVVLRRLGCSIGLLLGKVRPRVIDGLVDCLPVGIRGLEVLEDQWLGYGEVMQHVLKLLDRKTTVVPSLVIVAVNGVNQLLLMQLRHVGAAVGVKVEERMPSW